MGGGKLGVVGVASLRELYQPGFPVLGAQTKWAVSGAVKRGHWRNGRVEGELEETQPQSERHWSGLLRSVILAPWESNPTLQSPTK